MTPYDIITVPDDLSLNRVASVAGYPFLAQTVGEILRVQSTPNDVRIRWFQHEIIKSGKFIITSPRSGAKIDSADSLILSDRTVFYRFSEDPNLLLASCNLGRGYPITAIVIRSKQLLIQIGDPLWGVTLQHVEQLTVLLDNPTFNTIPPAREIRLFTGDPNFAHHIWNQLGALEVLANDSQTALPLKIHATFTPLGPLSDIFPQLKRHEISWISSLIPNDENEPGRIHVNLGGALVTQNVQQCVQKVARKYTSKKIRAEVALLTQKHHPIIWISIRSRNRTPDNQVEAITALGAHLFALYPDCAIILDGFSTPFDLATNANYHAQDDDLQIASDRAEAAKITDALLPANCPNAGPRIITAIGLPILDSLFLASTATFSFCHHGTVQHKIGWTTNTPGIVHSNPRTIKNAPGPWISAQIECPPIVDYIPVDLIENIEEDSSTNNEISSRLFENYRFTNIPTLVNYVCCNMQSMTTPKLSQWQKFNEKIKAFRISLWRTPNNPQQNPNS